MLVAKHKMAVRVGGLKVKYEEGEEIKEEHIGAIDKSMIVEVNESPVDDAPGDFEDEGT